MKARFVFKGGPGSGHHGHSGRPGKVGGSSSHTIFTKPSLDELDVAWDETSNWETERKTIARSAIDDMMSRRAGYSGMLHYDDNGLAAVLSYKDNNDTLLINNFATKSSGGVAILTRLRDLAGKPLEFHATASARDYYEHIGLDLAEGTTNTYILKGGLGSGNFGHAGRKGKIGGSAPRAMGQGATGGWLPKEERVWQGQQHDTERQLTNIQTGNIGEEMAAKALQDKLGVEFTTLNAGITNAPIDIAGDHTAVEVKAGPASNGKSAQHWRATIATEGKTERELTRQMSPDERRQYNAYKQEQVLERKYTMLEEMSSIAGANMQPATIGVILTPDGQRGDVFYFEGFHSRVGWNQISEENYLGTYTIDDPSQYKEEVDSNT